MTLVHSPEDRLIPTERVSDTLARAADLIEPEGRWTQGCFARDKAGKSVFLSDPAAKCFCVAGALQRCEPHSYRAWNAFDAYVSRLGFRHMADFNDQATQSEVVAALRRVARTAARREARDSTATTVGTDGAAGSEQNQPAKEADT